MKFPPSLQLLLAAGLLLAGCAIDEAEEAQPVLGQLAFRAQSAESATVTIPGTLGIEGREGGYAYNGEYLIVPEIFVDSMYVMTFTPTVSEDWLSGGSIVYRMQSPQISDTLVHELTPRDETLIALNVRLMRGDTELSGYPLRVDGELWPQTLPCQIQVAGGVSHELQAGEDCELAWDSVPAYEEQPFPTPTESLYMPTLDGYSFSLVNAAEGFVMVDGQLQPDAWFPANAAVTHHLAAFAPGLVFSPSYYSIAGGCPEELVFTATAMDEGYEAGQIFTDFTLPEVEPGSGNDLGELSLHQLRGRITLISFWSLTCVPCLEEMPFINQLVNEYGRDTFRVLAVNSYPNEMGEDFPEYDFHFLLDRGSPPLAALVGLGALPQNFILRRDGSIRSLHGSLSEELLREILDELE